MKKQGQGWAKRRPAPTLTIEVAEHLVERAAEEAEFQDMMRDLCADEDDDPPLVRYSAHHIPSPGHVPVSNFYNAGGFLQSGDLQAMGLVDLFVYHNEDERCKDGPPELIAIEDAAMDDHDRHL